MTQNRKRGRSAHEDETEFMPLSKRINNLHINNALLGNGDSSMSMNSVQWGPGPPSLHNNMQQVMTAAVTVQNLDWNSSQYNPELNESENPYYYNINKLLYEMYIERQQRSRNTM